ncbi:MAG: DUF2336 domain-containing protein, partial [Methylacidiphilales bacterium]|nr:DUF2336 domain-containing protein [Candidatus Methylacidiphilales bacterium]
ALRARQDLPPAAFERLMAQAAAAAAHDIDANSADVRATVDEIVQRAAEEIESGTRTFRVTRAEIHQLAANGKLNQSMVQTFMEEGRHDHALATVAELCGVPDEVVLRFSQTNGVDLLLIVAKSGKLDWPAVHAALRARGGGTELNSSELAALKVKYQRLIPVTCERIVGFWKGRSDSLQASG